MAVVVTRTTRLFGWWVIHREQLSAITNWECLSHAGAWEDVWRSCGQGSGPRPAKAEPCLVVNCTCLGTQEYYIQQQLIRLSLQTPQRWDPRSQTQSPHRHSLGVSVKAACFLRIYFWTGKSNMTVVSQEEKNTPSGKNRGAHKCICK